MSFFKSLTKAIANEVVQNFSSEKPYKQNKGDNPYGPGRGLKYYPIIKKGKIPPEEAGEYRINGGSGYIWESNNLYRRMNEHMRTGKISENEDCFEYKIAHADSNSEDRRNHERYKIEKHEPKENKRSGGGGRKPKK